MWKCPKCGSINLFVNATVQVRLWQYAGDDFETDYTGGDHEWGEASTMMCADCGDCGEAREFERCVNEIRIDD